MRDYADPGVTVRSSTWGVRAPLPPTQRPEWLKGSRADGATVPLYYEARKPELQLADEELKDELLDEVALDVEQEKKLQQTFGKQYHLITRNDRLD